MQIVLSIINSLFWVFLGSGTLFLLSTQVKNTAVKSSFLALGLLLGNWIGFTFTHQVWWSVFPPTDSGLWWLYFLPFLILFSIWKSWRPIANFKSVAVLFLFSGVYAYLLSAPLQRFEWSVNQAVLFCATSASLLGFLPVLFVRTIPNTMRIIIPITLGMMGVTSSFLFLIGSSAVLNQQALFLVCMQFIPLGMVWLSKYSYSFTAFGMMGSWLLINLWLNIWLFTDLSEWGLFVLSGLLVPWVLRLKCVESRSIRVQITITTVFCIVICFVSVFAVLLTQPQPEIYY